MYHSILERLRETQFLADFGLIASASALHKVLARSAQVRQLRGALASGEVTERTIQRFVRELLAGFEVGMLFPYDVTLAAIVVALQARPGAFVEEFLFDLARLDRAELPMAIRVAREAAAVQATIPGNQTSVWTLVRAEEMPDRWEQAPRFVESPAANAERWFELGAA